MGPTWREFQPNTQGASSDQKEVTVGEVEKRTCVRRGTAGNPRPPRGPEEEDDCSICWEHHAPSRGADPGELKAESDLDRPG
jgi:hypothetical protein